MLRAREHRIEGTRVRRPRTSHRTIVGKGDGILLTPNHSDHPDALVMYALGDRVGHPTYFMAAYQIFAGSAGFRHWIFPRIGAFPVDREGSDRRALKTALDILGDAKNPLVVFPEGEIYYLADRLTTLREGAPYLAIKAAEKLAERGRKMWIVPVGIKYRFLDDFDPAPALSEWMSELERRYSWWPHDDCSLMARVYHYAEGTLGLTELEYLASLPARGPLEGAAPRARSATTSSTRWRTASSASDGTDSSAPVRRRKELRRCCLDRLEKAETTEADRGRLRRDLHDLFRVIQLYSYPGDYIRDCPTYERVYEVLTKLEEDVNDGAPCSPRGPRRALVRLGEPIDVTARLGAGRSRALIATLTTDLEAHMQAVLDEIGPGRALPMATPPTRTGSPGS